MARFKLEDGAIVDTDRAAVQQRRILQRWRQARIWAASEGYPSATDSISSLESIIAHQDEKIAALEATVSRQKENLLIQIQLINTTGKLSGESHSLCRRTGPISSGLS